MAETGESVAKRFNELKQEAAGRNEAWGELWGRYTGEYYEKSTLEDLGGIKLTATLISSHVQKHTELFAFPPGLEVPPPAETEAGKRRADLMEKALYAIWEANRMEQQLLTIGCYLSLFGCFFMRVFPDPEWEGKIRLYACDPRECYPELSARGWQTLRRMFWEHEVEGEELQELYGRGGRKAWDEERAYTVIEYWDRKEYLLVESESKETLKRLEHGLGRVPFAFGQNLPLPRKGYGLADVEHGTGLEDFFNHMLSAVADITEYWSDPAVVIRDARFGTENYPTGPGAKIHVGVGGDAKFLMWEGTPPATEALLSRVVSLLADVDGVSETLYARTPGPVKSGAAVSRLLTSSQTPRLMLKQVQAGAALSEMNSIVLLMLEKLWGKGGVKLRGRKNQQPFEVELRTEDIAGWHKNFIRWEPGLWDYGQRMVQALQMVGAGLKSKFTAMEELGIRSPVEERKRIRAEQREDLLGQQRLMMEAQKRTAMGPGEVEREGRQIEKGGVPRRMALLGALAGAGKKKGAAEAEGEGAPEAGAEESEGPAPEGRLFYHDVIPVLARIHDLRGKAYVIGGIITEGYTDRDIDILVEQRADRPKILRETRELLGEEGAKRLHFTPTKTAPSSPHVTIGGVVPGGGLPPGEVKPFRLVPVAKPEKKALTTNEAFSIEGLRAKLPGEKTWDISAKLDGIRCQLHRVGNRLEFFTDEGGRIPEEKVASLLTEAKGTLPERCILDGELQLFLEGKNQHHEGLVRYLRTRETDPRERGGIRYGYWDILWNGEDLTGRPYGERSGILGESAKGRIQRAPHTRASAEGIPAAIKKVGSEEGAMLRAEDSAYWATHLLFKYKKMFDVDVTVAEVRATKTGGERYVAADRAGNIVGITYAASHLKGKVKKGDVITVSVQKVAKYEKGGKVSYHWFSPSPMPSTGIRRKAADPPSVFEEIWKETRSGYLRGGLKGKGAETK